MRKNTISVVGVLFALCLFLFVGCGTELTPPSGLAARPQTSEVHTEASRTEPTAADPAPAPEKDVPAYWVGETATLPAALLPETAPDLSDDAEHGSTARPGVPTTPEQHTTVATIDPSGNGRGDAYEVQGTNEYGVTVTIECTPFY